MKVNKEINDLERRAYGCVPPQKRLLNAYEKTGGYGIRPYTRTAYM
jgi:hypothetical protein